MSTIEAFANSTADHGLTPLESVQAYTPVFCTTSTTTATVIGTVGIVFSAGVMSDACESIHSGDVSSTGMPIQGSATELLNFRTSSIG